MTDTTNKSLSLTAATEQMREQLIADMGAENIDVFDRDAERMASASLGVSAIEAGSIAPDFDLPDARGGRVKLSEQVKMGPTVVVFYRGAWCPYCNLQLAAYRDALAAIEAAGASLVAISPQNPDASLDQVEQEELAFPVLSDAGSAVAAQYGLDFVQADAPTDKQRELGLDLAEINSAEPRRLPVASTFVVDTNRKIMFVSVSADYRWRVGPEEVLEALRGADAASD